MPSPFPGMDPYLEHSALFPGLHDSFVTYLRESLQAQLPEPYFADIGDRVWVEFSNRAVGPDVTVFGSELRVPRRARDDEPNGGVAVAAPRRTQPVVVRVPHDGIREPFIEIFSKRGGERLVTVIEVLSLANKTPGQHGRDLYLRKQQELLDSQSHLVEIDLLRAGVHTTAVPLDWALEKTGPFDYHACIHRFDEFEDFFVYPILLHERLPEIAIPLLPGDPSVAIDLQAVFERCYDTGPYRRRIDYPTATVEPPLAPERLDWARGLVARASA